MCHAICLISELALLPVEEAPVIMCHTICLISELALLPMEEAPGVTFPTVKRHELENGLIFMSVLF